MIKIYFLNSFKGFFFFLSNETMDMKMPSGCKGFKVTANRDRIYNLNNRDQYQPIIMKRIL